MLAGHSAKVTGKFFSWSSSEAITKKQLNSPICGTVFSNHSLPRSSGTFPYLHPNRQFHANSPFGYCRYLSVLLIETLKHQEARKLIPKTQNLQRVEQNLWSSDSKLIYLSPKGKQRKQLSWNCPYCLYHHEWIEPPPKKRNKKWNLLLVFPWRHYLNI